MRRRHRICRRAAGEDRARVVQRTGELQAATRGRRTATAVRVIVVACAWAFRRGESRIVALSGRQDRGTNPDSKRMQGPTLRRRVPGQHIFDALSYIDPSRFLRLRLVSRRKRRAGGFSGPIPTIRTTWTPIATGVACKKRPACPRQSTGRGCRGALQIRAGDQRSGAVRPPSAFDPLDFSCATARRHLRLRHFRQPGR